MSLLFLKLETLVSPDMLLICNLLCYIWYVFFAIVQLVVWSHKLVFRQHFTIDLLIYSLRFRVIKKEGSKMSDNSRTNSFFLWHAARILLSVVIIGLPILGAVYAAFTLT